MMIIYIALDVPVSKATGTSESARVQGPSRPTKCHFRFSCISFYRIDRQDIPRENPRLIPTSPPGTPYGPKTATPIFNIYFFLAVGRSTSEIPSDGPQQNPRHESREPRNEAQEPSPSTSAGISDPIESDDESQPRKFFSHQTITVPL